MGDAIDAVYDRAMRDRDVAATYLGWIWMRAVFHRGWWLVTSVYLIVVAELSASQLMFYGAVMAITMLLAEVPTGVMADAVSRKWSLVIAHLVMGTGMMITGLVTDFPLILVAQVFWGLGWAFSSGADVAWVTDELDEPDRISMLLITSARWEQVGGASGLFAFGALAWATGLGPAVVAAGVAMMLLGLVVAAWFSEHHFTRTGERPWREALSILQRGATLARRDHVILTVFAATFLVNGGSAANFLYPKQLLALGLPQDPDPIVWFTALGLVTLAAAALALRIVEARIEGVGAPRRTYAVACLVGALGLVLLAHAPEDVTGMAGVLLATGIAWPVTRAVSVIWVNQRATSDVRATVHSFLSQMEVLGEIVAGVALGTLARSASITVVITSASVLVVVAAVVVMRLRAGRESRVVADATPAGGAGDGADLDPAD